MIKKTKIILVLILVLNFIVLLGQIWPEGAPPFSRLVNIVFLLFNFIYLIMNYRKNH